MCALKGSGTFRQGGGKDMQMHRDVKREGEAVQGESKAGLLVSFILVGEGKICTKITSFANISQCEYQDWLYFSMTGMKCKAIAC